MQRLSLAKGIVKPGRLVCRELGADVHFLGCRAFLKNCSLELEGIDGPSMS